MTTKIKPINFNEALNNSLADIPDEVIDAFNKLITKQLNKATKTATVYQDDVVQLITELMISNYADTDPQTLAEISTLRTKIFGNKWLDVEPLFREAGWSVGYDQPAYNKTYKASYKFIWKSW